MLLFFFLAVVLALLDGCYAVSSANRLQGHSRFAVRQYLESIESGLNATTNEATIVPLTLSQDKQSYYTVVSLGNMSFRVAVDTGSSDFWIVSSACSTSACTAVPRYQLAYQSPTFVSVNNNATVFNVSYLDSSRASGFIARESVQMSNLTVPNQAFGLMNSSNVTFSTEISGIMGLGFPRLSTIANTVANSTPFFATMASTGRLDYPLFGLNLKRNTSGSLTFGAIDATVVTNRSLIEWNPVVPFAPFAGSDGNSSSYLQWSIVLSGLSVNGTRITPLPTYPNATSNSSLALIDVGTSGIYGPYEDVSRMFSLIDGSRLVDENGQWVIPCNANETMAFSFGGQNFTLQPTDYLIGPASGDPELCLTWPAALPPSSDGIDWQLGTPFLQTVYSIFSYGIDTKESPMIGFYPLNNASAPVEPMNVVNSFLSSVSATVATDLPNYVLPTPTYTTPAYAFNTSISAPPGLIVSTGLATSTYNPVLGTQYFNATAIPTVSPSPTLFTFILTLPSGQVSTSVSTASTASVTLGEPPGWTSGARSMRVPARVLLLGFSAFLLGLLT